jgi:Fe-S-cluster-containing dehydrogenase component
MANVMAIAQDVDKCMRCNGCVISCKRTWEMKGIVPLDGKPNQKVTSNQRVVIKPQRRVDTAPFVRFSCWHCADPPCAKGCWKNAIIKDATGPVYIDPVKCDPAAINPKTNATCNRICQSQCGRGGYPKIGKGSSVTAYLLKDKAWKCTMCFGRSGLGGDLPTKAAATEYTGVGSVPEKEHQPTCVFTCPAQCMYYDTRDAIITMLNAGKALAADNPAHIISVQGDGSMFWYSRKYMLIAPKADPFMEDHISPMVGSLLSGPFAKAALVPTLIAGGLLALAARRAKIAEEESVVGGEA